MEQLTNMWGLGLRGQVWVIWEVQNPGPVTHTSLQLEYILCSTGYSFTIFSLEYNFHWEIVGFTVAKAILVVGHIQQNLQRMYRKNCDFDLR